MEDKFRKLIITNNNGYDEIIRFKYYGDFEILKKIHGDCKDEISYIGNSNVDGDPIFTYTYNGISPETVGNIKQLKIHLRKLKIQRIRKIEMTKMEKSLFTFFNFLILSYDEMLIKRVGDREINYVVS